MDLGGHSQTIYGSINTGTTDAPVYAPGIVLNGTVQNGSLINASTNPGGGLFNYDGRSGLVSANLGELPSGSVGLTKTTNGTLTLSGIDTYTGGTVVSAGMLVFNTVSSIPTTGNITVNGGVLQFNSASLPLPSGSVIVNAGGTLAATGTYPTANAWIGSAKIANASAGALALVQDEGTINMTSSGGYANMTLGAIGNVSLYRHADPNE